MSDDLQEVARIYDPTEFQRKLRAYKNALLADNPDDDDRYVRVVSVVDGKIVMVSYSSSIVVFGDTFEDSFTDVTTNVLQLLQFMRGFEWDEIVLYEDNTVELKDGNGLTSRYRYDG